MPITRRIQEPELHLLLPPGAEEGPRGGAGAGDERTGGAMDPALTCRDRWLVSSGSSSGNSLRSMPPQSTTPSWVQPQSRGQAGPGPGRRRSGPPSGRSLSAAQPRASSAGSPSSASSARPPAGIAPAGRTAGQSFGSEPLVRASGPRRAPQPRPGPLPAPPGRFRGPSKALWALRCPTGGSRVQPAARQHPPHKPRIPELFIAFCILRNAR